MSTYFISYSRKDADSELLVAELLSALTQDKHKVYVDKQIPLGRDWDEVLAAEISDSDAFILLVSPQSAKSEEVRKEVRRAVLQRSENGRPLIIPVHLREDQPVDAELRAIIKPLQHFVWRSEADTPLLPLRIRAAVDLWLKEKAQPVPDPAVGLARRRRAMVCVLAAIVLLIAFFWGLPLFLDHQARGDLLTSDRNQVDRGLLKAALAGVIRHRAPSSQVMEIYRKGQHYDQLVATLSEGKRIGTSLAVSSGPKWHIVDGNQLWTCDPQHWNCEVEQFSKDTLRSSAFTAPNVITALEHGNLRHWDFSGAIREIGDPIPDVACMTAEGERLAYAVPLDDGQHSAITIEGPKSGQATPQRPAVITSLAFGPCDGCLTLLGDDGSVVLSDGDRQIRELQPAGSSLAIAGSSAAHSAAVLRADRTVALYTMTAFGDEPRVSMIGTRTEPFTSAQLAMSRDAAWLAIVYNGRVLLIDPQHASHLLVDHKTPGVAAAVFAADMLVTRTATDVRIWRLAGSKDEELSPVQLWMEWRKRILPASITRGRKLDD